MGLFSSIGKALGGVVKAVVPGAATFFGGPVGGVIGSVLGGGLDLLDRNVGPIIGGAGEYFSARELAANNLEMLDRQQQYNVANARTAEAFSERMAGTAFERNVQMQDRQFGENRYLVDQAIGENRRLVDQSIAENRASVERAQEFERSMSNTAYQRATADLRAAGLNPILLAHQPGASTPSSPALSAPVLSAPAGGAAGGAGASSPSGVSHSGSVLPGVAKFGPALATALQVARFEQDMAIAKQQEQSIMEDVHYKAAQSKLTTLQQQSERERTRALKEEVRVKAREAEDVEKYGVSTTGRNVGSLERIVETLWERIRGIRKSPERKFLDDDQIER